MIETIADINEFIYFTGHALQRMAERCITKGEVLDSIDRATLSLVNLSTEPIKTTSRIHNLSVVVAVAKKGIGVDVVTVYRESSPEKPEKKTKKQPKKPADYRQDKFERKYMRNMLSAYCG